VTPDPYERSLFKHSPYAARRPLLGSVVAVLRGQLDGRGLELIRQPSRVLAQGEIHELILTDEADARPDSIVERIAYLAFFEVQAGGVALVGDRVVIGGNADFRLAGFDVTHAPNHLNLVVVGDDRLSGEERGFRLGDRVTIGPAGDAQSSGTKGEGDGG
jgi:hypothetical protein